MQIKILVNYSDNDIQSSVDDLKGLGYEVIPYNENTILEEDVFYIYYRNPYIRYPELNQFTEIISAQKDYPCVYAGKELVGISKKYLIKPHVNFNNFPVTYAKPACDPIPILLYTHKRADYLKLSFNALIYSLGEDIDLTIAMSAPSPEVEAFVRKVLEKYPSIIVFKSDENIACAIINAYLQIQNPPRFIIFEEDYILPQHTKYVLPYWDRQFNYLLKKYDIVSFQTSLENQDFSFFTGTPRKSTRFTPFSFQHSWITDKNGEIHITGNGLASNTPFYASLGNNPPFYISGDGHVYNNAKNVCISSIHGYHIGWNQEMDGYLKLGDINRFPNPEPIQKIVDLGTGDTYTIDLRKITELPEPQERSFSI